MVVAIVLALALVPTVRLAPTPCTQRVAVHAVCSDVLSDDAISARLQRLEKQRAGAMRGAVRRPAGARGAAEAVSTARVLPGSESADVPVWAVPERLRMPGAAPVSTHGTHRSLEDVFPGTGLAEAWDTRPELRTALRRALRTDLFAPFLPADWDARKVACATGLGVFFDT